MHESIKSPDRFWRRALVLVLLFLAVSVAIDVHRKMWNDELFTYYGAAQPGIAGVYEAVAHGRDVIPPWYDMMVHAVLPVAGSEELAVRLPSTLGFCVMLLCLLAFCRRRMPAAYAYLAAAFACYACLNYATEGRFYGVVLGCAGGALLAWQTAADGRHRRVTVPLLAFCLGLTVALHYYAIFLLVPLLVAEEVRRRRSGKRDFAVLGALAVAPVVLALHYPLIAPASRITSHFWSPPTAGMILPFYIGNLGPMLVVCAFALIVPAFFPDSSGSRSTDTANLRPHEWAFLVAMSLLPPFVIILAEYTTHAFVERYLMWVSLGFAILAAAVVSRAMRGRVVVGIVLTAVVMLAIGMKEVKELRAPRDLLAAQPTLDQLRQVPAGTEISSEPVMVMDTHIFMELSYYADAGIRSRVFLGISRELSLQFDGWDSDQKVIAMLSQRAPIRVLDLNAALVKFPRLLLVATPQDYIMTYLLSRGYHVVPLRLEPGNTLYSVEAPKQN